MKNFQPIFNTKVDSLKVSLLFSFFLLRGRKILFLQPLVITLFLLGPPVLNIKKSQAYGDTLN